MQSHRDSAIDAPRSDASMALERGGPRKRRGRTQLQDELVSQSQVLQGYQQSSPHRGYGAEAEPDKEVNQDTAPRQKVASLLEQHSRNLGPDLRSSDKEAAAATIGSLALPRRGLTHRIAGNSNGKRLHKDREDLKRTISAPITIESPQTIAKPAFDAPVSAVNAGERRVKVMFDQNLICLPVTPSTTPSEIIRSAADQLAGSIDPNGTVLLESFKQLGLERPLRRYEHVRDVLNSWDNDMQNALVIKPSPTVGGEDLLDLHSVSTSQPVDTLVYIHYSQRPGHWDKRWVTLRSDGQMLVAKREGGETANICHMSDFDIYIPTARQSAKSIRPPRKICFAVKSQQKSTMFLSTANFVHFFSTSDRTLAATWYKAVLEWRSWYLVNVMGEGKEVPQGPKRVSMKVELEKGSNTGSSKSESQVKPPEPSSHGISTKGNSALVSHDTEHLALIKQPNSRHNVAEDPFDDFPFRSRSKPHPLESKKPTKGADLAAWRQHGLSFTETMPSEEPEPFAATGLLGRTYIQRQKVQREREKVQNAGSARPAAMSDSNPVNHSHRTLSQHPKLKPLIDLTPQYREPPQHARKGRGVTLEQIPVGGLVEVANTPEAAITIPPSTTRRRSTSGAGDGPSVGRSRTVQRDPNSRSPLNLKQSSTSRGIGNMDFTGELVTTNSKGEGGAWNGRGIKNEDRQAKGPMLDVGEEFQLEGAERQNAGVHGSGRKRDVIEAGGDGT